MLSEAPKITIIKGNFYLLEEFRYYFPWKPDQYIVIPKGYRTNFASIPWYGRIFISPIDPDIVIAALVHDWLVQEFNVHYYSRVAKSGIDIKPIIYQKPDNIIDFQISWNQSATIM